MSYLVVQISPGSNLPQSVCSQRIVLNLSNMQGLLCLDSNLSSFHNSTESFLLHLNVPKISTPERRFPPHPFPFDRLVTCQLGKKNPDRLKLRAYTPSFCLHTLKTRRAVGDKIGELQVSGELKQTTLKGILTPVGEAWRRLASGASRRSARPGKYHPPRAAGLVRHPHLPEMETFPRLPADPRERNTLRASSPVQGSHWAAVSSASPEAAS